jgi:thiol-disulfide isomerase/thioredoxin
MATSRLISRRHALTASIGAIATRGPMFGLDTREAVPNFKAKSLDGKSFSNESVRGKVTLVQFWTTWCQYCRRDQSAVDALISDFASQGLIVLAVNVGEGKRKVHNYLEQSPRSGSIVLLEDTNLAALFAARSFPFYVAFDRNVKIAGEQKGSGGQGGLRRLLRKAGLDSPNDSMTEGELQASPRRN